MCHRYPPDPGLDEAVVTSFGQESKPIHESFLFQGEVVEDHPGRVFLTSRIGGNRVVDMISGEQLPRIC